MCSENFLAFFEWILRFEIRSYVATFDSTITINRIKKKIQKQTLTFQWIHLKFFNLELIHLRSLLCSCKAWERNNQGTNIQTEFSMKFRQTTVNK